jgi:predicted CXXCH cytochrome family protein
MSFIVRTVARTADGRDIVRPKSFDKAELTVGRSPSSDIHLPDLAVTLNHAAIRIVAGGYVEVVATAGLPLVVNGKSTEHQRFSAAQGADIRIGSHSLEIEPGEGEEKGSVVVTVSRVGAISNASEDKEEARVFSLANVLPGKRPLAWALAGLVLAIFLIWPLVSIHTQPVDQTRKIAFHADELWTSGKLSQVHKSLENNCQACHVKAGEAVRDTACAACHTKVHDHADPKKLADARGSLGIVGATKQVVGGVFGIQPGRCVECHTEHQGTTAMPVTDERFCTNCHGDMSKRIETPLKNAADFGDNHPQFEPTIRFAGAGGAPMFRRVSLDANPKEDSGLKFPHDLHLSTTNGVAQMAKTLGKGEGYGAPLECANCHTRDATGTTFASVKMENSCGACHSLAFDQVGGTIRTLRHGEPAQVIADIRAFYRAGAPRNGAFQGMERRRPGDFASSGQRTAFAQTSAMHIGNADQAIRAVFSKGGACFDCHTVRATGNPTTPFAVTPVSLTRRYMTKGWFDHAAHDTENCTSCHAVKTSRTSADVNLPKIAKCQECHGGQDAHKAVPSSCAMCHDYHRTGFAPLMVRDSRARGKAVEHVDEKALKTAGSGI